MIKSSINPKVVAVADLLQRFSPQELAQLVTMVPALRDTKGELRPNSDTSSDAAAIIAHFRQMGLEQRGSRQATVDDLFIGGLTFAQYFALSPAKQDAFWEQLFAQSDTDMETMDEVDVASWRAALRVD
jgi:hypothetical protein